jgi:hypothetical protein
MQKHGPLIRCKAALAGKPCGRDARAPRGAFAKTRIAALLPEGLQNTGNQDFVYSDGRSPWGRNERQTGVMLK